MTSPRSSTTPPSATPTRRPPCRPSSTGSAPPTCWRCARQAANDGVCADPYDHDAADSYESRWLGEPLQTDIEVAELADPITYIPTATVLPPFSIAHGDDDCVVDVGQSQLLIGALEDAGQEPQVTILPGATHMDARFDAEVLGPTITWLQQVLAA